MHLIIGTSEGIIAPIYSPNSKDGRPVQMSLKHHILPIYAILYNCSFMHTGLHQHVRVILQ